MIGGAFTNLAGQTRSYVGRLTDGSPALQSLAINVPGTTATWIRGGAAPEVYQVVLEISADGTNYTSLRGGTCISDGWQFTELSLPAGRTLYLRARGRTTSGYKNGSSGLIESVAQIWRLPPPFLSSVQALGGGVFQFSFTNTNAVYFSVLAGSDVAAPIAEWEVLGSPVPVGGGIYQFTDPGAAKHERRFYQLRSP